MSIETLLGQSLSGSERSKKAHLARGKRMEAAIRNRWGLRDHSQWRCKHVHWFLNHYLRDKSSPTRYDYWSTVCKILARLGKLRNWEGRLTGPWDNKQGLNSDQRTRGVGGRPMKLPKCPKA